MSKKKRKFRVMTNQEYCNKQNNCTDCVFNKYYSWCDGNGRCGEPCELPNGKYILIEVKDKALSSEEMIERLDEMFSSTLRHCLYKERY